MITKVDIIIRRNQEYYSTEMFLGLCRQRDNNLAKRCFSDKTARKVQVVRPA